MAKKAKKGKAKKPQREITKRQLSRWQRQRRRQRIILSAGIFTIAVVFLLVAVGWYASQYRPLHQTVIRVNDTEFNMKYYIDMLKLRGEGQIVQEIGQNEFIRQGALKLGVSVSDAEVKEERKSSNLPANDAARDLVRSQLLIYKLQDEYFEYQVPASAEQAQVMAMLLESESQAVGVSARLESGESFTELAGELSLEYFTKTNEGDLGWHPKNILSELLGTSIPVEYAFDSEVGVLSQPLYDEEIEKAAGYWIIKVLSRGEDEAEEAYVHTMLLGSEEEAQDILHRLVMGEDFAALAKEFSRLFGAKENEGDLGMVTKDQITPAFDGFVFNLDIEPGTLSEPIRDETVATKGGYWLVKVVDRDDNRQIDDDDRYLLKLKALDEWVSSLGDDPNNKVDDSLLDEEKKAWATEQAMKR